VSSSLSKKRTESKTLSAPGKGERKSAARGLRGRFFWETTGSHRPPEEGSTWLGGQKSRDSLKERGEKNFTSSVRGDPNRTNSRPGLIRGRKPKGRGSKKRARKGVCSLYFLSRDGPLGERSGEEERKGEGWKVRQKKLIEKIFYLGFRGRGLRSRTPQTTTNPHHHNPAKHKNPPAPPP